MVVPLSAVPLTREGFYAVNNQFLVNGPKGFTEFKMLENGDMYVRIDLPGVPKDGVKVFLENPEPKITVDVHGDAPKEHKHDDSERKYLTITGVVCECCRFSGFTSDMAYESKQLQNGSLYVRLDMPGVPDDSFTVSVENGRVKVTGQAPAVSHDSSGRFYSGDVAMLDTHVDVPSRKIKTIAKNGVIRLIIPPL